MKKLFGIFAIFAMLSFAGCVIYVDSNDNQADVGDEGNTDPDNLPNNEIWYTSTYGGVEEPHDTLVFGANIVSNTYEKGRGVIRFDGEVTSIGDAAFLHRACLVTITIPESVTSIGNSAFEGCKNLETIAIPKGVTSIGDAAFSSCSKLETITIPEGVTSIGNSTFSSCKSLATIAIPESVTSIGWYAFSACSSLVTITIPESVTLIEGRAFENCSSLAEFKGKFASEDGKCLIIDGVLHSFANGCGLTKYTIPEGVSTIGFVSFHNCKSLTEVVIGDGVTSIEGWAFDFCVNLASITIPEGIPSIEEGTFNQCRSLTNVTIPQSVTLIGEYAFQSCDALTEVYCKPTTPPSGNIYMFANIVNNYKIYVPTESEEAYKMAEGWCDYADAIVGYDFN